MSRRTVILNFEDVREAMKDQNHEWFIDPETGGLCMDRETAAFEFGEDLADDMAPKDPDDVLELPWFDSSDGYRLMEKFAARLADDNASEVLETALRRPKPFRRFKDALYELPETVHNEWYLFEAEEMRRIAEDFYESEGIRVEWKKP